MIPYSICILCTRIRTVYGTNSQVVEIAWRPASGNIVHCLFAGVVCAPQDARNRWHDPYVRYLLRRVGASIGMIETATKTASGNDDISSGFFVLKISRHVPSSSAVCLASSIPVSAPLCTIADTSQPEHDARNETAAVQHGGSLKTSRGPGALNLSTLALFCRFAKS